MLVNDSSLQIIIFSMTTTLLSSFTIGILLLLVKRANLLHWFYQNRWKIITALICAIILTPFALFFATGGTVGSGYIANVFFVQLMASILIAGAVLLLINLIERRSCIDRPSLSKEAYEIRETVKNQSSKVRPSISFLISKEEKAAFISCFENEALIQTIDDRAFANFVRLLVLTHDGKKISLESFLSVLEAIQDSDACTVESAHVFADVLKRHSVEIDPEYYQKLYDWLKNLVYEPYLQFAEAKSPVRYKSQEDYEMSQIVKFRVRGERTEETAESASGENAADPVQAFSSDPDLVDPDLGNLF